MTQIRFKVEDGLLVRGQANITGNTVIGGTLKLEANVVSGANVGGNIHPTSNVSYDMGTAAMRWRNAYFEQGKFSDTLEVTNKSSLYGGVYLEANVEFKANGYSIGNTTATAIVYSSNTFIYDTLKVAGTSGDPYLQVNSTSVAMGSNLALGGSKLSLKGGAMAVFVSNSTNFDISTNSNSPTAIDDTTTASNYKLVRYTIYAKRIDTAKVQSSVVVLMWDGTDVYLTEHSVMSSDTNGAPFMTYSAATGTGVYRLVAYAANNKIDISYIKEMIV